MDTLEMETGRNRMRPGEDCAQGIPPSALSTGACVLFFFSQTVAGASFVVFTVGRKNMVVRARNSSRLTGFFFCPETR